MSFLIKEAYKQSEFGLIPSDWYVSSFEEVTVEHKQGYYTKEAYADNGVRLLRITDLKNPKVLYENSPFLVVSDKEYDQFKVEPGDFLFARSGAIGRYGIVPSEIPPSIFASYLIRFKFDTTKVVREFLGLFYESDYGQNQISKITQGSSNININANNIKTLKLPLPPFKEQQKIADILSVTDEQIEKTEQLIEKTNELKKGLMQQLLTKGIGHNEFKETELGNIPIEWDIIKIDDIFHTIDGDRGKNYPNNKDFLAEGYCIFLDTKNVTKKGFSFKTKKFISKEKDATLSNGKLSRNDIVMTSRGTIGNIAYYDESIPYENLRINSAMLILRSKLKSPVYKFWIQMLRGRVIEEYVRKSKVGSAQPHITKKSFKELKVAIPHKTEEQQKIADILSSVDNQIEVYEKEKEKQVELKKALMQQLLTGQLRVTV